MIDCMRLTHFDLGDVVGMFGQIGNIPLSIIISNSPIAVFSIVSVVVCLRSLYKYYGYLLLNLNCERVQGSYFHSEGNMLSSSGMARIRTHTYGWQSECIEICE